MPTTRLSVLGTPGQTQSFAPKNAAGEITVPLGQASETDEALAITAQRRRAIGQASETDTARPIVRMQFIAVGQVQETDIAQPMTVVSGAGTYTSQGNRLLYTAGNWSGVQFYFEVDMRSGNGNPVNAKLYDETTTFPVSGSTLTTTSTTFSRIRTGSALSLIDGHEYGARFNKPTGSIGEVTGAFLIAIAN